MNDIGVSVYCLVYNHERYLRKCLDGFVMQKTDFAFEVIVHDDASTDGSADIIREYEEKYPDIIKPIYQTENQYSKKISIVGKYILPRIRGKYVACCEGDDYWCDADKLQLQYDAMEACPQCRLCVHKVGGINGDASQVLKSFPSFPIAEGVMEQEAFVEYIAGEYAFQTSSYFRRTEDVMAYVQDPPAFKRICDVGDVSCMLYCATLGPVYYIDREMSHYRMQSAGSWSAQQGRNAEKNIAHYQRMLRVCDAFDEYSCNRFQKQMDIMRLRYHRSICALRVKDRQCARFLCKKENREYVNQFGLHFKASVFANAYCPRLAKLYYKIKGNDDE